MDEEKYENLVRQRRQRDDFVVDDGAITLLMFVDIQMYSFENYTYWCLFACIYEVGLGYYDDGEEHVGVVEPGQSKSARMCVFSK